MLIVTLKSSFTMVKPYLHSLSFALFISCANFLCKIYVEIA